MPIDPSIPLSVRPVQIDPVGAYGQAMQLRNLGQRNEENDLDIAAKRRAADDAKVFSDAISQNTVAGADGLPTVDHQAAMAYLAKHGKGALLMRYRDEVSKWNEQQWRTEEARLKTAGELGGYMASQFQGVQNAEDYAAAMKTVRQLPLVQQHPELTAALDAAPEYSPEAVAKIVAGGMGAKPYADFLRERGVEARAKRESEIKQPGEIADAATKQRANASTRLSNARSAEEYAAVYQSLDPKVAQDFDAPDQWDAQTSPARARHLGMTPNQEAVAARGAAVDADRKQRTGLMRERLLFEKKRFEVRPDANDPEMAMRWREYTNYVQQHATEQAAIATRAGRTTDYLTGTTKSNAPTFVPADTFEVWRAKQAPYPKRGATPGTTTPAAPNYGTRGDGSPKGEGFLGVLKRPDGRVSSEISIGVNIDGKEVEIPTLVPTLDKEEVQWLLTNDISDPAKIPDSIVGKATAFARQRIAAGQSPFASASESPKAGTGGAGAKPGVVESFTLPDGSVIKKGTVRKTKSGKTVTIDKVYADGTFDIEKPKP